MPSILAPDEAGLPAVLTPEGACERLAAAFGLSFVAEDVSVELREDRWLVRLPGRRLAWLAATEAGRGKLTVERRVLQLLEARCTFEAPRVLHATEVEALEVRSMVAGASDARVVYEALRSDPTLAADLGAPIGRMLAEQHSCIVADDVAGWLARRVEWPESAAWIAERLPRVIDDAALVASAMAIIERYASLAVADADAALVHGDLGLHNIGIDLAGRTVRGLFDYDAAAWADRHHDFRYLVLDLDHEDLFESAAAAYEQAIGRRIDRARVLLYNAACAVTYLAYRDGVAPDERWCGRTLAEDLRWSRRAIARAVAD